MLYAIISDIHSNLEALEAVLGDALGQGVEGYLCLGDIVGYGAQPQACIEKLRGLNVTAIAGNHDYAACGKTDTDYFNTYARRAVHWTAKQLNEEDSSFLAHLPLVYRTDKFCMVHGSLDHPEHWEYILTEESAFRSFLLLREKVLFVGHSHVPFIFSYQNKQVQGFAPKDVTLDSSVKYIVNVGSVGQPRDLDNRASYCIFDLESMSIRFRRVSYDFRQTQKKILEAKLPEILAQRLELGR
jgi:predicted phosphodiesterase